ncbi:serine/threonine-protein kinase M1 [Agyrium rufum]|nr:serine/threonine-protein kinase M1 [Agyrium rufum]
MSIFTDVLRGQPCPSFAELLSWNPTALTVELLKLAADGDENAKARCRQAIVFLATEVARRAAGTPAKKHDVLPVFFERNVLGIMTSFSQVFTAFASRQSLEEKARSLGAIREMIKIGKSSLCNGLPQIRAILQSAMEEPILCDEAFRAWGSLLNSLGQEDLETLINPTFAIIAQYWGFLTSTVQEETHTTTTRLFTSHPEMIQAQVLSIPSLASVPLMHKIEDELVRIRSQMGPKESFHVFDQRCKDENAIVVTRALIELDNYLKRHEDYLHINAISEKPDMVLSQLTRSILDACVKFSDTSTEIAVLCAQCLGRIGCLDPTRLDANREVNKILVLSNFSREDETVDFVLFFLQEVLVKAFLSARDSRAQNFLGYAIQELLKFSRLDSSMTLRSRDLQVNAHYRRWVTLPDSVREVLAPFLNSKLTLHKSASLPEDSFPIYRRGVSYTNWLRGFVSSLLRKGRGSNAEGLFKICQKVIPRQDIAIASFLLPYAALNVVAGGQDAMRWGNEIHEQVRDVVTSEILLILSHPLPEKSQSARDALIECSQSVFHVLDYFSQWVQEKRKELANMEQIGSRSKGMGTQQESEFDIVSYQKQNVELVLSKIPAEVISQRAIDCKSFSRALYHWEQHIRDQRGLHPGDEKILEPLYKRLQDIYTQIDEPDGIEGISAHLQVLSVDQQVLQHRNAGRWTTVQNYYELLNSERPNNPDIQISLLKALKESGQYDVLLNQVGAFQLSGSISAHVIPFAVEASWATGKWENLKNYLSMSNAEISGDFNIRIGKAFAAFRGGDITEFSRSVEILRLDVARSLTFGNTSALHACHDPMLKLHVITEIEAIIGVDKEKDFSRSDLLTNLDKRLDVLGAFSSDKQYLLGIRRAAIQYGFLPIDESSTWLTGARLARKSESINQAFNSVLRASKLGDHSATIEHSRLLWKVGQHRKAIQSLEGAIAANAFRTYDYVTNGSTTTTITNDQSHQQHQNLLTARAHLLLAKWNDKAGQTQSEMIIQRYKRAVDYYCRWEKGHYHLGKHYNKLLESEQSKHPAKQAQTYINGEMSKLVIENYLRSLAFGAKYIYQTIPKILTLWLELGNQVDKPPDAIYGNDDNFRKHTMMQNRRLFEAVSAQMKKYIDRLPAFVFYTAFSQIVARICHSNQTVYGSLVDIIVKVVTTHPQQALWTLLATVKSSAKDRSSRGASCIVRIQDNTKKAKHEATANDMRTLIMQGQKLSDQLLRVTDMEVAPKVSTVSISRDLNFRHNGAPCRLVIPLESTLTAALPPVSDNVNIKTHKAFPKDALTISAFLDEVLVLSSLQRPRRISIRGSDGRVYNILCKPKDDLRKDQRLMEFNTMINRALKKDVESSKRRLYIKTYAVTPLNEECGLIEWVDNLKTLRDILLKIYKQKNTSINYQILRDLLDQSIADYPHNTHIFREKVLSQFQPVFHEWFVEMFPEPSMWFAARLRYTRSCAVMSLVGHVLGLGDRHGENILFEEGSGGTFHVDFNCLFDKGLNFEKPEVVPFRLTQNMVDAFGAYGYEGPFRKSCELSLAIMRQYEDTLMTILETFLWDPTTDFLGGKKKKSRAALVEGGPGAPDTPEGVLENVRGKNHHVIHIQEDTNASVKENREPTDKLDAN